MGSSLPANGLNVVSNCYPAVSLGACHEIREFHEYTVGLTRAFYTWVIPYWAEDPVLLLPGRLLGLPPHRWMSDRPRPWWSGRSSSGMQSLVTRNRRSRVTRTAALPFVPPVAYDG